MYKTLGCLKFSFSVYYKYHSICTPNQWYVCVMKIYIYINTYVPCVVLKKTWWSRFFPVGPSQVSTKYSSAYVRFLCLTDIMPVGTKPIPGREALMLHFMHQFGYTLPESEMWQVAAVSLFNDLLQEHIWKSCLGQAIGVKTPCPLLTLTDSYVLDAYADPQDTLQESQKDQVQSVQYISYEIETNKMPLEISVR